VPAWRRNREILRNAGTLVATTGVSALLGFAFWAIAARFFSQEAIGYAAATTSAITLLGTIGTLGLGTFLIAELPRRSAHANLIAAAMLAAGLASMLLGLAFVLVAPHISTSFRNSSGTLVGALIFIAGVILTAATFVFDQASIGLLRGGLQLTRNIGLASAKLLVLPLAAFVLHDQFGIGIALSWVTGTALSVIPIAIWLWWKGTPIFSRPDWAALHGIGSTVATYSWLSVAILAPTQLIPILVTVLVSPVANGAFYAAWMMASLLYLIPIHLSTVLFAVASNNPRALSNKIRFTLRLSLLIGVPGMALLALGGRFALAVFGPSYVHQAELPLLFLVLAYIPMIPRTHYVAVCRASGEIARGAAVMTVVALIEIAAIAIGAKWNGLVGLSIALAGARCLTGAAITPAVLRAALGRGRHRRGEREPGPADTALLTHAAAATEVSQRAALALLLLMSTPE
jgi:O-antigen/teichoic acid export membrane protein